MIIAADVGALFNRERDLFEDADDIFRAADAVLRGDTGLGDHQRKLWIGLRKIAEDIEHPLFIEFVTHRGDPFCRLLDIEAGAEDLKALEADHRLESRDDERRLGCDAVPHIILDAEPIELPLPFRMLFIGLTVEIGVKAAVKDRGGEEMIVNAARALTGGEIVRM